MYSLGDTTEKENVSSDDSHRTVKATNLAKQLAKISRDPNPFTYGSQHDVHECAIFMFKTLQGLCKDDLEPLGKYFKGSWNYKIVPVPRDSLESIRTEIFFSPAEPTVRTERRSSVLSFFT